MTLELLPFSVPNYVIAKMPPRPRQDGLTEAPKFPLENITADELAKMCGDFRAAVFAKAGKEDPEEARARREAR